MSETEIRFCGCNCGGSKEVPVDSTWKYFRGHNLRINNPAKNPEVAAKIAKSNTGKKRSEASIEKQKKSMKSSKKFADAMKNRKPPREGTSTSPQGRENMRQGAINRKTTPEFCESRRRGMLKHFSVLENRLKRAKEIAERVNTKGYQYKTGYVVLPRLNTKVFYRSSYEKDALLLLDSKLEVSDVKAECVFISYMAEDGCQRVYIPDYLITLQDDSEVLIEVKPKDCIEGRNPRDKDFERKSEAAIKWANENDIMFCIWTEDVLHNNSSTTELSLQAIVEATVANPKG